MILTKDTEHIIKINLSSSQDTRIDLTHHFTSNNNFVAYCSSYDEIIKKLKFLYCKAAESYDVDKIVVNEYHYMTVPINSKVKFDWIFKIIYKNEEIDAFYICDDEGRNLPKEKLVEASKILKDLAERYDKNRD